MTRCAFIGGGTNKSFVAVSQPFRPFWCASLKTTPTRVAVSPPPHESRWEMFRSPAILNSCSGWWSLSAWSIHPIPVSRTPDKAPIYPTVNARFYASIRNDNSWSKRRTARSISVSVEEPYHPFNQQQLLCESGSNPAVYRKLLWAVYCTWSGNSPRSTTLNILWSIG